MFGKPVGAGVDVFGDPVEHSVEEVLLVVTIVVTLDNTVNNITETFDIAIFNEADNFVPRGELDDILLFEDILADGSV